VFKNFEASASALVDANSKNWLILNDIRFLKISRRAIACSLTSIRRIGFGFKSEPPRNFLGLRGKRLRAPMSFRGIKLMPALRAEMGFKGEPPRSPAPDGIRLVEIMTQAATRPPMSNRMFDTGVKGEPPRNFSTSSYHSAQLCVLY
jgi:hypothetical protein